MSKTILITGSTDGIGLETAKMLAEDGHLVLMHGRSASKLETARAEVGGTTEGYVADLSDMNAVARLAREVAAAHDRLDVLINNAGVYKTPHPTLPDGSDIRFVVNTLAPYALTRALATVIPAVIPASGRIINLSSAAQAPVNLAALRGEAKVGDMDAYAQSKLALTMWSRALAADLTGGPVVVAVNPGSLLASKMVKEGFGVAGNDIRIGADILRRAALSDEFANASGAYFDNDAGGFGAPHPDALNDARMRDVVDAIEAAVGRS
ncbi:MAG: SDR family NAD(P)-dependent oxidoreductase [Pseudomonadota bacterium]